jgi:hypothetical protein
MKIETLKKLIAKTCDDISQNNYGLTTDAVAQIRDEIFNLIDLYEEDREHIPNENFKLNTGYITEPDQVPYGSICPCNPANGGSGICGCVMGNKMVPNPKKYPGSLTTSSTDKINITTTNPYSTNITWEF